LIYLSYYILSSLFSTKLLLINYDNIRTAISSALPSLILCGLASMKGLREYISLLDSMICKLSFQTGFTIPLLLLLLLIHQAIVNPTHLPFSTIPTCSVALITLLLMYLYHRNRAHKHGCLLTSEMKSQSVFTGIAILLSCSIALESPTESTASIMTVFLLGSLFTLLISYSFAAVSDVWYTVGSGQFQMTSLDTAGIWIYFICPAVILYFRFIDKYGEIIAWIMKQELSVLPLVVSDEDVVSLSLVLSLAMITAVGVPLLNSLCPMGGYLFSRAYTHGQPNTKKIALCANFSDLLKATGNKRTSIWKALEKKKVGDQTTAILNIYVTLEELTLYPTQIQLMVDKGHFIALVPTEFEEEERESFCGLSMFQGNTSSCNLHFAQFEYTELFGEEPTWVLSKSADSIGRHPSLFRVSRDLGLKVAYWSTYLQLTGDKLSSEQKSILKEDCSDKNGGSIIYITIEKGCPTNSISTRLCEVVDSLDGYTLESLSNVAKDDAKMIL